MDNDTNEIKNEFDELKLNENKLIISDDIFKLNIPEKLVQETRNYDEISDELINNYKSQTRDYVEIAKKSLDVCKSKSTIIYSMGISVEMLLKYILILNKVIGLNELSIQKHNIPNMFNVIMNSGIKGQIINDIQNIEFIISTIKTDKGKNIDFRDYTVYRYNHTKKSSNILLKNPITKRDVTKILEVLKCVENIITVK